MNQTMQQTLTPQQDALIEMVRAGAAHMVGQAVAGAGKTTTMVAAAKQARGRIGFVAFNKHIADHLQTKLNGSARACTLHSLGYSTIRDHVRNVELDENKSRHLLREIKSAWFHQRRCKDCRNNASQRPNCLTCMGTGGIGAWMPDDTAQATLALARLAKLTLTDVSNAVALDSLIDHYGIEMDASSDPDEVRTAAALLVNECGQRTETIDFDDMIWLPAARGWSPRPYDLLMVDECQDLNRAMQALALSAVPSGRVLAVGDHHQCQPAQTMIAVTGGDIVAIEDIKVGQQVISFCRESSAIVGRKSQGRMVLEKASREYKGPILTVSDSVYQTRCTPEHRWIARWAVKDANLWATYLMRRGNWFRIGWCQLFTSSGLLHLAERCQKEKAESAWILGLHKDKTSASIEESVLAAHYGLCLLPFEPVNGAQHITRESIDSAFNALSGSNMQFRAGECLARFGRLLSHPFYSRNYQQRQGRTTIFETSACNLIGELMAVPVYVGEREPLWRPISVTSESFAGTVYSLKIADNETYIADGLVTHNSIMGFSGADNQSMARLHSHFSSTARGAVELPLTVTFRCPTSHVALARKIVPQIEARAGAPAGVVVTVPADVTQLALLLRPDDLVICRKNAPLIGVAFRLFVAGRPVLLRGRDIGRGMLELVDRLNAGTPRELLTKLKHYQEKEEQRLEQRDAPASAFTALEDRVASLAVVCSQFDTLQQLRDWISRLFSDDSAAGKTVCSSVHRAKGLEADRVFIVEPECMPMIFICRECWDREPRVSSCTVCGGTGRRSKPWEIEQEYNLLYVAITRARQELYFAGPLPSVLY